MDRFSYSSLESYKSCPAQFKIRYIDGVRKSDEGIEAFMGKRVHEALEYLYNEVLDGHIIFFDHVVNNYRSRWQSKWHKQIGIVRSENSVNYYKNLGEDCLARYYRQYTPFLQNIVSTEVELNFSITGDENYRIKGFIDRLDHDGEGNWEIHDYKSGKRYMTQNQADNNVQLALYQIGLMTKEKNLNSIKLVWHFLQHGIEVESNRSTQQLNNLSNKIMNQIDGIQAQIENGGKFPAKESILCNWCYYWEECPAKISSNPFIKN